MFKLKIKYIALLLCIGCISLAKAQVTVTNPNTDKELLSRFENAKLGLFVHWMACHSPETGDSWSIGKKTPKSVADSITMQWNPEKFDAVKMVDFAVRAGCKYMVVISKHHDGFCIWDSKYSNFDLERISFKRDILKELGDECRRRGLLFGIYYSIADIDYCGWKSMPTPKKTVEPKLGKEAFIQFNKDQVKELIENYNPDILWFDGFWLDPIWTAKEGKDLYFFIKSLKWNTLSTRLAVVEAPDGKETFFYDGSSGDYFSLEAKTTDAPPFPWESCTSVTYPVYAYEPNAKMLDKSVLIESFSKSLCGNGNFLLNIGPKPTGELPEEQTARFLEFSAWIKTNSEAVYNAKGGPFKQGEWGGSTYNNNKIYLHLREKTSSIKINTLDQYKISSATDIRTGKKLKLTKHSNGEIEINNVASAFSEGINIPVIALVLDKPYIFSYWIPLYK